MKASLNAVPVSAATVIQVTERDTDRQAGCRPLHIHPFTHACARGHQGARASLCLSVDGPYDPLCQQRVFRGHVARNSMREYILAMMRQLEEDEVFGKDAEAFELVLDDDLGMLVCTVQCARAYRPTHAHIYLIPYLYLPIASCFYLPISRHSWPAPLLVRYQQLVAAEFLCPAVC